MIYRELCRRKCGDMRDDAHQFAYDEQAVRKLSDKVLISTLAKRIRKNLKLYYGDLDISKAIITGKPWGGKGTSRTFRFKIRAGEKNKEHVIFVKLCPVFPAFNMAVMEYETLKLLYAEMPNVRKYCNVALPLDFFPDLNAYAMESVGTKSFKAYLLKKNSLLRCNDSLSELFSLVSGCASWLSGFHEITKSNESVCFDSTLFIDGIKEDFDYYLLKDFKFKDSTLVLLEKTIGELCSLNGKFNMPCSKWHYDFTPAHVFISNDRINVIDILGIDDNPIYDDVGHFLAAMATINSFPFYPLFDYQRANRELCDRFLEAYLSETSYDRMVFTLFSNIFKLKHLLVWFQAQYTRFNDIIDPFVGKAFANLRLVKIFEESILSTINKISIYL